MNRLRSMATGSARNEAWAGKLALELLAELDTADTGVAICRAVRPRALSPRLFRVWLSEFARTGGGFSTDKYEVALHAIVTPGELAPILDPSSAAHHYLAAPRLHHLVASCVRNFPLESLEEISSLVAAGKIHGHESKLATAIVSGFTQALSTTDAGVLEIGENHLLYILERVDGSGREGECFAGLLAELQRSRATLDHSQLRAVVGPCLDKLRELTRRDSKEGTIAPSLVGLLAMLKADDAILKECSGVKGDELWLAVARSSGVSNHGGAILLTGLIERIWAGGPNDAVAAELFTAVRVMLERDSLRPDQAVVCRLLEDLDPARLLSALPLSTLDLTALAMRIASGASVEQVATSLLRHSGQEHVRELMLLLLRRHSRSVPDEQLGSFCNLRDRDTRKYEEVHYGEGEWRERLVSGGVYDFQAVRSLASEERERRRR